MWMYALVYVDDLIIVHEDDKAIAALGKVISKQFKLEILEKSAITLESRLSENQVEVLYSIKVQRSQSSLISLD